MLASLRSLFTLAIVTMLAAGCASRAGPKVVVISLDGAQPELIDQYLKNGVLRRDGGLARLAAHGVVAEQNITVTPSVTALRSPRISAASSPRPAR